MIRRYVVLSFVIGFILLIAVHPGVSHPPPEDVPGICGDSFERAADENGIVTDIERCEVRIEIDEDGTGRWIVRIDTGGGDKDRFRNQTLLNRIVSDTYMEAYGSNTPVDKITNIETTVNNGILVVRFDIINMAEKGPGGVFVVDTFKRTDSLSPRYNLVANEVVIVGPEDTSITQSFGGGEVEGNKLVWSKESYDEKYILHPTGVITFAPGNGEGLLASLSTHLSIATTSAPTLVVSMLAMGIIPSIFLGTAGLNLSRLNPRVPQMASENLWMVLSTGSILIGAALFVIGNPSFGALWVSYGVLCLGVLAVIEHSERSFIPLIGVVLVGMVSVPVSLFLAKVPDLPSSVILPFTAIQAVSIFLFLGYVSKLNEYWEYVFVTILIFLAFVSSIGYVYSLEGRIGLISLTGWAFVVLALGAPMFLAGHELRRTKEDEEEAEETIRKVEELKIGGFYAEISLLLLCFISLFLSKFVQFFWVSVAGYGTYQNYIVEFVAYFGIPGVIMGICVGMAALSITDRRKALTYFVLVSLASTYYLHNTQIFI